MTELGAEIWDREVTVRGFKCASMYEKYVVQPKNINTNAKNKSRDENQISKNV